MTDEQLAAKLADELKALIADLGKYIVKGNFNYLTRDILGKSLVSARAALREYTKEVSK